MGVCFATGGGTVVGFGVFLVFAPVEGFLDGVGSGTPEEVGGSIGVLLTLGVAAGSSAFTRLIVLS